MKFKEVLHNIKTLQIQGAEEVAVEGIRSLILVVKESRTVTKEGLLAELYHAKEQLISVRPTEPCLRNALSYVFENIYSYSDEHSLYNGISQRIKEVLLFFENSKNKISILGANKIRHGSIVYTHCHSSTVVAVLLKAKQQGKRFSVHNTETRPMYQGRKTASELAAAGIPVRYFVDSAASVAMKDANLCLLGADAITYDAVYNKIGSGLFAEHLHFRKIPLHICSDSWKFDPAITNRHKEIIEERPKQEVWQNAPIGVVIEDPAFEPIILSYITTIISELGVLTPLTFLRTVKQRYKWLMKGN